MLAGFTLSSARAGAGVLIVVDSTSDLAAPPDGSCSLRGAIFAANNNGHAGGCTADGSTGPDTIVFDLGSGAVINVGTTDLPSITQELTIDGGSSWVTLNGPGKGTGLTVYDQVSATIRGLVIHNFSTGIRAGTLTTIAHNVIGPNSSSGVYAPGGLTMLGGTNTGAPDTCAGDCNVIEGNAFEGVYGTTGGTIKGNFIGISANGTAAPPNGDGILITKGNWTIGGPTTAQRNVISGNNRNGMLINACYPACFVQGNYIGTDTTGTIAMPNAQNGIFVKQTYALTIGGTGAGEGNVISGNTLSGIQVSQLNNAISIVGNRIGTRASGGPLPNSHDGIALGDNSGSVRNVTVSNNIIAYNGQAGVHVSATSAQNVVRRNSIHDNGGLGIQTDGDSTFATAPPVISGYGPVHGTSCANCTVDIYSDATSEGANYHGSVIADASGNWLFGSVVFGPYVTATSTSGDYGTSAFSAPLAVPVFKPDGRIRLSSSLSLLGDNIYNTTGASQTVIASTAAGNTLTFVLSIQNDSQRNDMFKLRAFGPAATGFTVRYYVGQTERTAAIQAGTFMTPALPSGQAMIVTAVVDVTTGAPVGSNVNRLIAVTSADPNKQDAVRFVAKRS
jgi:CSLREA domain-containing protein